MVELISPDHRRYYPIIPFKPSLFRRREQEARSNQRNGPHQVTLMDIPPVLEATVGPVRGVDDEAI
jgi:hypothetical protein